MDNGCWNLVPSSLAQWVGGLGTVAAVIIALFKDPIRGWWNKPKLKATCAKEIPWTVKVPVTTWEGNWEGSQRRHWNGYCYFIRIKVENKGRTRAEKVEVSVLRLAKRGLDNKFEALSTTLPFNLRWSNSPSDKPAVLDGISRDMSAFCDVVSIIDPANPFQKRPRNTPDTETVANLQLEFAPLDEWHILASGTYRLTLKIGAANAEPIDLIFEFKHDGMWVPDDVAMRRDHLAVSVSD